MFHESGEFTQRKANTSVNWHPTAHIHITHGRRLRWWWSSWVRRPWGWSSPCPGLPRWCGSSLYCCWWCRRGFLDWCCTSLSHFPHCQGPLPTPGQGREEKLFWISFGLNSFNNAPHPTRDMNQRKKNNSNCNINDNSNKNIHPTPRASSHKLPSNCSKTSLS